LEEAIVHKGLQCQKEKEEEMKENIKQLHGTKSIFTAQHILTYSRNSSPFVETKASLSCSLECGCDEAG
jgi:hypothetical protein